MRNLTKENIENIATGASFMGAGGGGNPYTGKLMVLAALEQGGQPITLLDVTEVDPDALYIQVACMGAPSVMMEKFPRGDEFQKAIRALEKHLGKQVKGTFPIEAGGVNSMIPLVLAAQTGLPVVDCDSMGRAFPELQMTTLHLAGVRCAPMVVADEKGNLSVLETVTDKWAELLARDMTVEMGATACVAQYASTGQQLQDGAIHGIVTKCEQIGAIVHDHKLGTQEKRQAIVEVTGGYHLFDGKVVDVIQKVVGGFNRGTIVLEGLNASTGQTMEISYQNENLVAHIDGQLVISVPDLICFADVDSLVPITTEEVKYGKRMTVFGLPSDDKWRTEAGVDLVGPRYFGFDFDFVTVEELLHERGAK